MSVLTLCLDGSTDRCCAALVEPDTTSVVGPRVLGSLAASEGRAHARLLLRLADELVVRAGRRPADLGAVVVGVGPGTFTGVRVAVASARALGLSLDIPVYGVPTPAALAAQAALGDEAREIIVPVVDARRGQVFWTVYRRPAGDRRLRWSRESDFVVGSWDQLVKSVMRLARRRGVGRGARPTLVTGYVPAADNLEGGLVVMRPAKVLAEHLVVGRELLPESPTSGGADREHPRGVGGQCDHTRPGRPEAVRPIYVRPPDADVHITKMRDPWGPSL